MLGFGEGHVYWRDAGKVTLTRASSGTPVPLQHRDRFLWFGGWSDETTFYGLSRSDFEASGRASTLGT
ncbi:MAG: hypothetical protein ABIQ59_18660 [Nocardioidaceae bacterium]